MAKHSGKPLETAWKNLRPMTKEFLETAFHEKNYHLAKVRFSFDAHADWEIGKLLAALDKEVETNRFKIACGKTLYGLAEICAQILESRTSSAETFIQLATRAIKRNNYAGIDRLADILLTRFTAAEIAEIIRQSELVQIRAIAFETLALFPVKSIEVLVRDPLYFEIGSAVLDQQYTEFEVEEAGKLLEELTPNSLF
ncbi:MAG: hypothetical protein ACK5NT_06005 [Pyrinomonadaceae bacterium]